MGKFTSLFDRAEVWSRELGDRDDEIIPNAIEKYKRGVNWHGRHYEKI